MALTWRTRGNERRNLQTGKLYRMVDGKWTYVKGRDKKVKLRLGEQLGFDPFVEPTKPPSGTYDPTLDAQERAAQRGYQDLFADLNEDPDKGALGKTAERDLNDYRTAWSNIDRNYQIRGNQQTQAARQAGVAAGGALMQALEKRRAAEGIDKGQLSTSYQRARTDRIESLARAQRELGEFKLDTSAARFYQAKGTGYEPPSPPKGKKTIGGRRVDLTERKDDGGTYRQFRGKGGELWKVYSDGRVRRVKPRRTD